MNVKSIKEDTCMILPENYQMLTHDDIDQIMSGLVPCKEMTPDECRNMMDERLGETNLSSMLINMRRESRS